ncbi:MAG: hypothetical protein ACF8PN_03530 [Phycisphaerales bacterium]
MPDERASTPGPSKPATWRVTERDPDESPDPAAELAHELRALGAETATRRQVKQVAPWVISVGFHLLLVFVGFLIPWTTQLLRSDDPPPTAIVAEFESLRPVELVTLEAGAADTELTRFEDRRPEIEPASPTELLADITADPTSVIGPSVGDPMDAFAPRASGLDVSFGGLRGTNARNIVYIVDASGSMIAYLPIVIDELVRSIDQLADTQRFAVIFFQRNDAILVPAPGQPQDAAARRRARPRLMPATEQNKLHVFEWIDLDQKNIRAVGKSNPLEALKLALDQIDPAPDVVFILSTNITGVGEFEVDQGELFSMIQRMNRGSRGEPRTLIKTIQFIYDDPLDTLRLIAERNGGADGYRFLSREELGLGR